MQGHEALEGPAHQKDSAQPTRMQSLTNTHRHRDTLWASEHRAGLHAGGVCGAQATVLESVWPWLWQGPAPSPV